MAKKKTTKRAVVFWEYIVVIFLVVIAFDLVFWFWVLGINPFLVPRLMFPCVSLGIILILSMEYKYYRDNDNG